MGSISLSSIIFKLSYQVKWFSSYDFFNDVKMMERIKEVSAEVFYTLYEQFTCLYFQLKVKCKRSCKRERNGNKKEENRARDSSNRTIATMEEHSNHLSSVD